MFDEAMEALGEFLMLVPAAGIQRRYKPMGPGTVLGGYYRYPHGCISVSAGDTEYGSGHYRLEGLATTFVKFSETRLRM